MGGGEGFRLHVTSSGQAPVAGSSEDCHEPSGFTDCGKFLNQVSEYN
jgi:hypothetical protein